MPKKTDKIETNTDWKNLHIFGYGETRLVTEENIELSNENLDNSKEKNINLNIFIGNLRLNIIEENIETSKLTKAQALIDFVYSKKPIDNNAGLLYHAITIVNNNYCVYVPKSNTENHFSFKYNEIDALLIEDLITEIKLEINKI
jgi:hypothetical protein